MLQFTLQLHATRQASEACAGRDKEEGEDCIYRILTVSKGWVAVTAPQAAMPPAMKAL